MEVIQRVRVACPRCGAAVAGDFKFCPTCAYRLKKGTTPVEPDVAPRPRSVASLLLAVSAALFVALLAVIGVWIFRDQTPVRTPYSNPAFTTAIPVEGLTVETLPRYMRRVPEGVASFFQETDEEGNGIGEWLPKHVGALDALIYEVPRSFYAEFCADARRRTDGDVAPFPALASIWAPKTKEEMDYARLYLAAWLWDFTKPRVTAADERRPLPANVLDLLPEEARKKLADLPQREDAKPIDDFTAAMPFPWTSRLGLLLLAPPSWVSVNQWDEFVVEMPHGTGSLPVTEVTWSDACAFAEWATLRTGGAVKYRLPVAGEWVRIAHGNHPPGGASDEMAWDFPWGKTLLRHACNNAELYGGMREPSLQPVGLPYRDVDATGVHDGTTVDGIFDMSGNAREWVLFETPQRVNGVYRVHYDTAADSALRTTPTYGGSYLMRLDGCRIVPYVDQYKFVRHADLGFRLVAEPFR